MGQNPTDSEVHDMINEVDVDGSGVVEFEEFVNFFARLMKNLNPQNEVREAFRRWVLIFIYKRNDKSRVGVTIHNSSVHVYSCKNST